MNSMGPATSNRLKMYRRPIPLLWWLQNGAYFRFVVRELTSLWIGFFAVLTIWQVRALGEGPDAYAHFLDRLATPGFVLLNGAGLAFVLYHAITWFNLAPTAIVVRLGEKRVPDWIIAGLNYVACVSLSAAVAWILLRG